MPTDQKGETMENAAKALRIAAGVIIGVLLVALLWYMYHQFVEIPRQEEENAKEEQMVEFNKKYMAYDKQNLKGNKIISLMNMAIDNNVKYSDVQEYQIEIEIKAQGPISYIDLDYYKGKKASSTDYQAFIDEIKNKFYKCTGVETKGPNGRISKMTFEEINMN